MGTKHFWARVLDHAASFDRSFAIRINARIWLQPLYGDYTIVGRILGPIFRTMRILLGFFMYAVLFLAAFFVWIVWLLVPAGMIVKVVFP